MQNRAITHVALIILFALLLPIIGGELLNAYLDYKFIDIPVHSLFESIGGFIALTMSAFLYYRSLDNAELYKKYIWVVIALSTMGTFDIFHAILPPGNNFVWFHSLAVFSGGLFFSLVWISRIRSIHIPIAMFYLLVLLSLSIVFYSLLFPQDIPSMLNEDGAFSLLAKFLNLGGGLFFILATFFFMIEYKHTQNEQELLFVGHTLLFGIAGLLFNNSVLFDAGWWFWHVLRLTAYMLAQYFIVLIFLSEVRSHKKAREELKVSNLNLHEKVGVALIKQQTQQSLAAKSAKMTTINAMISLVSNQCKTPLQSIKKNLNALMNKYTASSELQSIQDDIHDIEIVIDDFLKLHHISKEDGKQSLRDALESSIDIISPLLYKTSIDIQTDYQCLSKAKDYTDTLTQVFIYIFQYLCQKPVNPEVSNPKIDIVISERSNNIQTVHIHENYSQTDDDALFHELVDNKNPLLLAKSILANECNSQMDIKKSMAGSTFIIELEKQIN